MCSSDSPCTPDSADCCEFNNQIYEYLRAELPGPIPWNFAKVRLPA